MLQNVTEENKINFLKMKLLLDSFSTPAKSVNKQVNNFSSIFP